MNSIRMLAHSPSVEPTNPLVWLAVILLSTAAQAQTPVELTSGVMTTNGAAELQRFFRRVGDW